MKVEIKKIINIAREAGDAILAIYEKDFEVYTKNDESPLTEADQAANAIILDQLLASYPDIPYISEEVKQQSYEERKDWEYCWLIDPLDGTKEFIKKNGEFTVNIALIHRGVPVLGVVHVPVQNKTYYASKGEGAFVIENNNVPQLIENRSHYSDLEQIVVVASRSHLSQEVVDFVDDLKAKGKEVEFLSSGSSLKFCLVAEGKAHVYPRLAPTMEWDTAAAHAVCLEAGKDVLVYDTRQAMQYNREDLLNPWFIVE
ncbi:3'(2'),5'-bisphosphate nucleotidase CysQ [Chitinophagales bacterium]|nr:3'(2'),5'-bisphosphate nucleotidase CysQ [Chitinophagales bacterium]